MSYDPKAKTIEWTGSGAKFDGKEIPAKASAYFQSLLYNNCYSSPPKWFNNILDANGNTPMSRLNKIPTSLGLEPTFCKFLFCEHMHMLP